MGYEDVSAGAGVFLDEETIEKWESTSAVDSFNKNINKIFKAITDTVHKARKTGYDTLILDLDGDGFNIETKELGTNFDLNKNGFLCLDLNGNGTIDDG